MLQELKILQQMAYKTCCSAFDVYTTVTANIVGGVLSNTVDLEEQAKRAVTKATAAFDEAT